MSLVLVVSCIINPLQMAFQNNGNLNGTSMKIIIYTTDGMFLIEIFVNFICAFHGPDFNMVDDLKPIASSYLKGWFMIDLIAIIPFEAIANAGIDVNQIEGNGSNNFNNLVRFAKLGKLNKLIRLTRLLDLNKILGSQNNIMKFVSSFFNFG